MDCPVFVFAAAIVKRIDGRKHPKVLRWPVKPQEQVHLSEDGTYGAGVRFWCFVCPVRRFRIPFPPHAFLENPRVGAFSLVCRLGEKQ